jgi:glyoxylase-like metal-dependent hydrolase (beta-lactamase superfamily II)
LREEAAKEKKGFDVLASPKTIPLLADENYNKDFDHGPYASIGDVIPIKEGDRLNIGEINLRVFDLPGHAEDQIGILDEKNGNLFAADAVGNKVSDGLFFPPFMPPAWDPDDFLNTIDKLKGMDYKSLSLGHFGYIYGDEAREILDETLSNTRRWWALFEENEDDLDDSQYMLELIKREIEPVIPPIRVLSRKNKILLGLMNSSRKLLRKAPVDLGDMIIENVIKQLAVGYRVYKNRIKKMSTDP